jgi:hypothetical protein
MWLTKCIGNIFFIHNNLQNVVLFVLQEVLRPLAETTGGYVSSLDDVWKLSRAFFVEVNGFSCSLCFIIR